MTPFDFVLRGRNYRWTVERPDVLVCLDKPRHPALYVSGFVEVPIDTTTRVEMLALHPKLGARP